MKRTIFALATMLVVFVAVIAVLALRPVRKVKADHHGCTPATLKGSYGLVGSGFAADATVWFPATVSGVLTFNGAGGVTGADVYTYIGPTQYQSNASFSNGTYTINPNCSFEIQVPELFGSPTVYIFGTVVDTGGDELTGQLTNTLTTGGTVIGTGDAKRIATGHWNYWGD